MRGNGKRIVGKSYAASCWRCDVPPWELCQCSPADLLALNARIIEPVRIERRESTAEFFNLEADRRLSLALT